MRCLRCNGRRVYRNELYCTNCEMELQEVDERRDLEDHQGQRDDEKKEDDNPVVPEIF